MYLSWSEDRPAVKRTVLTIYTIGYGSRTKGALLNLLELHNVGIVVDVRRWPTSKLERFRREHLSRWLSAEGIDYIWMGEELGGYRKGGYKAHVKSEGFRKGVQHVLTLAAKQRTCLLCLEVSPRGCHRRFVATYLNRECGVKVLHILSKKRLLDHTSLSDIVKPHKQH